MAIKVRYEATNGKSFQIIKEEGKAPYKVLFMNADGSEQRRTHHKTLKLAFGKCSTYNPNWPVENKTGE